MSWTESYRPKTVDDIVGSISFKSLLSQIRTQSNNNRHFRCVGLPGCGKTSFVHAMIKEWYPDPHDRALMVLEKNASDDFGVDRVRQEILPFMSSRAIPTQSNPQFKFTKKILVLDEADQMTMAAQSALRCPMEEYAKFTLVILIGNYEERFMEPIQSRTNRILFPRLTLSQIQKALQAILLDQQRQQKVSPDISLPETHSFWSLFLPQFQQGDLRKAIQCFQLHITLGDFDDVSAHIPLISMPPISLLTDALDPLQNPSLSTSELHEKVSDAAKDLVRYGYTGHAWARSCMSYVESVSKQNNISIAWIYTCMKTIAQMERQLASGADLYSSMCEVLIVLFKM